ncbi:MAG: GGDEF domain-containing protein [Methyloligellaceae bacterium]
MAELDRLKMELSNARHRVSELEDLADEDPLVPTLNRRGFVRELERVIAYVNRYKARACIVYIDLDGFKQINDQHGHAAGDEALKFIAEFLLANVRGSDIVGRLGGDEFAVVLQQTKLAVAGAKAAQLENSLAEKVFLYQGRNVGLSFSAGAAEITGGSSVAEIFERADKAMFARKKVKHSDGTD